MAPRNNTRSTPVERHPTGAAGSLAAAVVAVAAALGLDISAELAAAIVGLVTAVVSYFTPRTV